MTCSLDVDGLAVRKMSSVHDEMRDAMFFGLQGSEDKTAVICSLFMTFV